MKKEILIMITLISVYACKNEAKDSSASKFSDVEVWETIILPNHPLWTLNRLDFEETPILYNKSQVFKLIRTSTTETAFTSVNNIAVTRGNNYKVSVFAKQALIGGLFGLRIIGEYPNRIDAVFDLKNGSKKDAINVGDFVNGNAKIESMGDGWYKCSVIAEVNADKIKIMLGPTSGLGKTIAWEAATRDKCEVYIIPTSLTLEEL